MESYDVFTVRHLYPSEQNPVASNWVYDQVAGMERHGLSSLVLAPTPYVLPFLRSYDRFNIYAHPHTGIREYKGTKVVRPSFIKIPKIILYSRTLKNFSKALLKAADGYGAKLIHAHFGYDGVAALPLKQKLKLPMVTTFYGGDLRRYVIKKPDLYKELVKEGELFLGISEVMTDDLRKLGFPDENIAVWHLGIKMDTFKPGEEKEEKKENDPGSDGDGRDKLRFLSVARLSEGKRIQDGLTAFKTVHEEYPDTEYVVVGFGPQEELLKNMAKELGLADSVKFINNIIMPNPREVVQENMRDADVFILPCAPATVSREGTPVVLMEAQASGLPCVSTDYSGIPEVVLDEKTGFIIKPYDTGALAQKMISFIEDEKLRRAYSRAAREHVEQEFNQEKQIEKLVEIYKGLMS